MFRRSSINRREWFRHSWRNLLQTSRLFGFLDGYPPLLGWLIWGSAVTVRLFLLKNKIYYRSRAEVLCNYLVFTSSNLKNNYRPMQNSQMSLP